MKVTDVIDAFVARYEGRDTAQPAHLNIQARAAVIDSAFR